MATRELRTQQRCPAKECNVAGLRYEAEGYYALRKWCTTCMRQWTYDPPESLPMNVEFEETTLAIQMPGVVPAMRVKAVHIPKDADPQLVEQLHYELRRLGISESVVLPASDEKRIVEFVPAVPPKA